MNEKVSCECMETTIEDSSQLTLRKKLVILPVTLVAWWIALSAITEGYRMVDL